MPRSDAQHADRFQRGDATGFRRAGARRLRRVEAVDVVGQVGGATPRHAPRLLGRVAPALVVELLHRQHAHAGARGEAPHVRIVRRAADADLDDAVGIDQPLVHGAAERRAVMEARAKVVVAGVAMGVDMDHADGPLRRDRAQYRQADRVVAADRQRHDLGRDDGGVEGGDLGRASLPACRAARSSSRRGRAPARCRMARRRSGAGGAAARTGRAPRAVRGGHRCGWSRRRRRARR